MSPACPLRSKRATRVDRAGAGRATGRLEAVATEAGLDLADVAIVDVPHSHAAAQQAVALAAAGEVEALMKGPAHRRTDVRAGFGSSGVAHQAPGQPLLPVADTGLSAPVHRHRCGDQYRPESGTEGRHHPQRHRAGAGDRRARTKVAILAAVETVSPTMAATLDAAALCKMADRGQITGGLLDGPLAFDNAVSIAAARIKGIVSEVAGQADILVVPDLESGNMLAKQLIFMGGAASAGIVLGAKVPVILTSRADSRDTRIASCAIALMLAHHYRLSPP